MDVTIFNSTMKMSSFSERLKDDDILPVYKADESFLNEIIRSKKPPVCYDPDTGVETNKGQLVQGIPYTTPDRSKPSITLRNPRTGEEARSANTDHVFSQQSISKTIAYAQGIELVGSEPAFRKLVGTEASGEAYNAHKTLPDGRAPNPHVNLGAISTHLINHKLSEGDSLVAYQSYLRQATGNPNIVFKSEMANGEYNEGPGNGGVSNNRKMVENMVAPGGLIDKLAPPKIQMTDAQRKMDGEAAFLKYCYACSGQVTTKDLAAMAAMFENKGLRIDPDGTTERVFSPKTTDAVRRANVVSGSYNESGTVYVKDHAGVKTGVEGGIMGTVETADGHHLAIGTYHPDLNGAGNSGAGQKYIHSISEKKIAFPSEEKDYLFVGAHVKQAETGEFGESPYDMNNRLMNTAPIGVVETLRSVSRVLQPEKNGAFYLKDAAAHDAKYKSTSDEVPILNVHNRDGSHIRYSLVDSSHALSKIRVRTEK